MSEGAEHRPATLTSWLDAERAELEDRRSRIALQIEALADVEAAIGRYLDLSVSPPVPLTACPHEDVDPHHPSGEPPGDAPARQFKASDCGDGIVDGRASPAAQDAPQSSRQGRQRAMTARGLLHHPPA